MATSKRGMLRSRGSCCSWQRRHNEHQLAFSGGPPSTSSPAATAVIVPLVVAIVAPVPATDEAGNPPDDEADGCAAPFAGVDPPVVASDAVGALPPARSTGKFEGKVQRESLVGTCAGKLP